MTSTSFLFIRIATAVAVLAATAVTATAQAAPVVQSGPLSRLYLDIRSSASVVVVQGTAVVAQGATYCNHCDSPIAVYGDVRTAAIGNGDVGGRYDTNAQQTGTTYTLAAAGGGPAAGLSDGTTDGRHNYGSANNTVYIHDREWGMQRALFTVAGQYADGITYDPSNNSLWVSSIRTTDGVDARVIEDYALDGSLLFGFESLGSGALAMDYADGTLWQVRGPTRFFDQFDRHGVLLQTVTIDAVNGQNGTSAEFDLALANNAGTVPEPGSFALVGLALLAAAAARRKARRQGHGRVAACGLLTALAAAAPVHAAGYTFATLAAPDGVYSQASAINASGRIAGYASTGNAQTPTTLAVQWASGSAAPVEYRAAGLGNTADTYGLGLNNSGQMAGYSAGGDSRALLWAGTLATDMGSLGGRQAVASAVNNFGVVVGSSQRSFNSAAAHGTLWNSGLLTDLGTLGGLNSSATAINDAGQVVGVSYLADNFRTHATLWQNGLLTDLGTLGGNSSSAADINAIGLVVGQSWTASNTAQHATAWYAGFTVDLGTLGGTDSRANAVNNTNVVVGRAQTAAGQTHAVLWDGNVQGQGAVDLNGLLDAAAVQAGWLLIDATDINDSGAIVGNAYNTLTGAERGFVLTAVALVPEPTPAALLLAGAGVLVLLQRRRAT